MNSAGKAIRRLSLRVHTLPTFTRRPGDVVLSRGEQLELVCEATGSPEPRISWTADGQPLTGAWAAGVEGPRLRGGHCPASLLAFSHFGVLECLVTRVITPHGLFLFFLGGCSLQRAYQGSVAGASCGGQQPPTPTVAPTCAVPRTVPAPSGPPASSPSWVGALGVAGTQHTQPSPLLSHPSPFFPRGTRGEGGPQHLPSRAPRGRCPPRL